MKSEMSRWLVTGVLAGALGLFAGCGGGDDASDADSGAMIEETAEPVEEMAQSEEGSTTDSIVIDLSQPSSPAEYEAAFKQGDYVAATESVLRMSANNVEGANSVNRMRELQEQVARAAANGDPQARRAAELLRRVGRMPTGGQ
jgi:hypothetical protein